MDYLANSHFVLAHHVARQVSIVCYRHESLFNFLLTRCGHLVPAHFPCSDKSNRVRSFFGGHQRKCALIAPCNNLLALRDTARLTFPPQSRWHLRTLHCPHGSSYNCGISIGMLIAHGISNNLFRDDGFCGPPETAFSQRVPSKGVCMWPVASIL